MDWREFEILYRTTKGWSPSEITNYWAELKNDPSVKRDMLGKRRGEELQLDVPVKRQGLVDRTSFQEKHVEESTKPEKNVGADDLRP